MSFSISCFSFDANFPLNSEPPGFLSSLRAKGTGLVNVNYIKVLAVMVKQMLFTDKVSPSVFGWQQWPKESLWLKSCYRSGQGNKKATVAFNLLPMWRCKALIPWLLHWCYSVTIYRLWLYWAASSVSVEQDVAAKEHSCSVNIPWINKGKKK